MDNFIFKSLTCGVTFKKQQNLKQRSLKKGKFEKLDSDRHEVRPELANKKQKKMSTEYLRQKQLEETSKIRKQHNINVKGAVEKIKPIESFNELFQRYSLDNQLIENIKSFKYSEITPVQMQIIPIFLEQKSTKVVAPTGSGKFSK